MEKRSAAIIGTGKIGSVLGWALKERGWKISAVTSRGMLTAKKLAEMLDSQALSAGEAAKTADVVWLTVPDREIAAVAGQLAEEDAVRPGQFFLHTSGALPADILQPVKDKGAYVFALHPLHSFAVWGERSVDFSKMLFCADGDIQCRQMAEDLVSSLGGELAWLESKQKPLYHAAAVFVSNYLTTLVYVGCSLQQSVGLTYEQSLKGLLSLAEGTINNIKNRGPAAALTGPVERGDSNVIAEHLTALDSAEPYFGCLYRKLAIQTVSIALQKGSIGKEQAADLTKQLGGE